ncbi:putative NAD dependent epimerase/dehydratase [Xylariaceae sp. FL0662B]|nr:putative NAD dependent epimerase/dehydratase [Xylariaceae sp. FL0662B]
MTGANGYIGSVISEFAIAEGYEAHGLSRTEASDATLAGLGAVPVRGDLHSLDVLRRESARAQIVMHLADPFVDGFNKEYDEVIRIQDAAVDAMAEALQGTDKPLLVASGTLLAAPDPSGAETTEASPPAENPIVPRIRVEDHALGLVARGVRVMAVRFAPYVYGRGGSGAAMLAGCQKKAGRVTSSNATSATNLTARQLAEAMAAALQVPLDDITSDEADAKFGQSFTLFLTSENRASSAKAVKELGWQPREVGILEDIKSGSYQAVVKESQANAS